MMQTVERIISIPVIEIYGVCFVAELMFLERSFSAVLAESNPCELLINIRAYIKCIQKKIVNML